MCLQNTTFKLTQTFCLLLNSVSFFIVLMPLARIYNVKSQENKERALKETIFLVVYLTEVHKIEC